jgi:(2Fe-2S) ferredoxin
MRLNELKGENALPGIVLRTQANCFQVCQNGPIAVVYPEGVWYRNCDESAIDNIIQSHIIEGKIYHSNSFENKKARGQ